MGSEGDGTGNAHKAFKEGAVVRVRDEDGDLLDATIVRQHRNGDYTVKYDETGNTEKNVPKDRVQSTDEGSARNRSSQDKDDEFEVDSAVQFKNEKGEWRDGDEVVRNVERRDIRVSKSPSKKRASVDAEEDSDDEDRAMRKRKARARGGRSKRELVTSEDESDESVALYGRADGTFEDKSGRIRRGRIKMLNRDQQMCDVEHESDAGKISKRIPLDVVRPTTAIGRFFSGTNRNFVPFQLNTHVYYRTKDGMERKGIVLKVSKTSGKTLYDVEDLLDGAMIKQLSVGKLRAVPWLDYSLPNWNGLPALPSFSLFSAPILRRGLNVRFRRTEEKTGRVMWKDGVIMKAKSNACCIVEYFGPNGDSKREEVKNSDIQARFFRMPFSGMMDGVLDGLSLPSIQLPAGMIKAGSAVEVSNGAKVFLGSIVSSNEMEKTYTIRYEDGRKEKSVPSDRVRLSLRRLRIGTEVEMIVEGPCKEVSKLDGEVAWIHRDEKVAVRINGGNNDVFAEVCTHALMVDGKPAFTAPLSSTWLELMGYYLNLAAELVIYTWFFFGFMVEMDEMLTLHEEIAPDLLQSRLGTLSTAQFIVSEASAYLLIPSDVMATDRAWIMALLVSKAILTASCALLVLRCLRSKLSALQDDFIDLKEYQQERVMRRHLSVAMGWALIVTFMTLVNYASLLNRFDFYCLLNNKTLSFDELALSINPFAIHSSYSNPVQLLISLAAKTTSISFEGGTNFIRRVAFLLPSMAVTALLCAVGGAALHTFYYVQKTEMLSVQTLEMSTNTDLSVLLLVLSLWFIYCVYSLGLQQDDSLRLDWSDSEQDVLDLAERGEFGLQAQREALVTKVEQRQDQLGVCKLSILRIYRHILVHFVLAAVAIYIDVTLRRVVKESNGSSVALNALAFHLAVSITWLIGSAMAAMFAISLRQQSPELLAYILDV
ncbi:Tudor domain [Phytophthora cactorum]|nr:Tudor domain [Phytophthora cactorum]